MFKTEIDIYHQYEKIINIYIVYELSPNTNNYDFTLENCLLGSVNVLKDNDIDNYEYSGYGIGFDLRRSLLFPDGGFAQNEIIFGVDMSSSVHANNKAKDILILGGFTQGFAQGLEYAALYAEKKH